MGVSVSWNEAIPERQRTTGGGGGKSGKFLKFDANGTYILRPVGQPWKFYKYYYEKAPGDFRSAITEDPATCPVRAKYPNLEFGERYGIVAIDRADGRLKVVEIGFGIYKEMKKFYDFTKDAPGGAKGGDFIITVTSAGNKKSKMGTKYKTDFKERTPFTQEELGMFAAEKDDFKLEVIFKSNSAEEIENLLFGERAPRDGQQQGAPAYRAAATPAPAPAPAPAPVQAARPAPAPTPAAQPVAAGAPSDDPFKW